MTNANQIAKLMGIMTLAWPHYELKKESIDVYARILVDVPADKLELAAKHLMATSTFFPSISEWRKAAFDIMINKPSIPSAFEAWEIVLKEIEKTGSYREPHFDHPIVKRAVDCMGWSNLCLSEQLEYDRAHFFKIYDSLLSRAENDIRMLPDVKSGMQQSALEVGSVMKQLADHLTVKH
jgi:hypothetical protein